MAVLHRLQWIDAQIRAGRHPNTRGLAEAFEISRRQALRDFEYLRDSLGAPLAYSAYHRGYYYTEAAYTLPGPYVTGAQREVLGHLAVYYDRVARQGSGDSPIYREMAKLFQRLGGNGSGPAPTVAPASTLASAPTLAPARWAPLEPFRALLRFPSPLSQVPSALAPYWRGATAEQLVACEFREAGTFVSAVLGAGRPCAVEWPGWLRDRLISHLNQWLAKNHADMTRHVTPTLVSSVHSNDERLVCEPMIRKTTNARLADCWTTWAGATWGALTDAGLCDLSLTEFMGLTGTAFRLTVHQSCDVSGPTVYPWLEEHQVALERIGVLAESACVMPESPTYEAACRRAVTHIKAGLDRGVAAVLWGVDTGEFGVIYGYDDADGVFLASGGFGYSGTPSDPILYENVGKTFQQAPILHYQVAVERVPFDVNRSRRASLAYYVAEMERPGRGAPGYASGLKAYETWEQALRSGKFEAFGVRYQTAVYADAKHHAARFLEQLAADAPRLGEVADLFAQIAGRYAQMCALLEMTLEEGGAQLRLPVTPEQASAQADLVREAAELERKALALVRRYLAETKEGAAK